MRQGKRFVLGLLCAGLTASAAAQPPVQEANAMAAAEIPLVGTLILAPERGATYSLDPAAPGPSPLRRVILHAGRAAMVDTGANRAQWLGPGRYLARCNALSCTWQDDEPPWAREAGRDEAAGIAGYRLADWIMTRQQQYIDDMSIDVRIINSSLSSLLRALIGRSARPAD